MEYLKVLATGLSAPDAALAVVRISVGLFFAISGYNKLFNAGRHASITANLTKNKIPFVGFMQWWVPGWEFVSGALLMLGLATMFNAAVLSIICIVACLCEAKNKVESYHPINAADRVDDYLYLPEVLYLLLLTVPIFSGGGDYSLDALIFNGN